MSKRALGALLIVGLVAAAMTVIPSHAAEAPPIHLIEDLAVQPTQQADSQPRAFTQLGSVMLFAANDGVVGDELWKTDGTPAGTSLVKDMTPGPDHSFATRFTVVGSNAFFLVDPEEDSIVDLWVTDGTSAGTHLVESGFDNLDPMVAYDGALYFFVGGSAPAMWKSDGTPEGTVQVKTFPDNLSTVRAVVLGDALIFSGNQPSTGYELWISDGTTDGTVFFKELVDGTSDGDPDFLTVVGSTLYFRAYEPTGAMKTLWKSDGTPENTVVVEDPTTTGPRDAGDIVAVGSKVFFHGFDATNGAELWVSDGTTDGTHIVENVTADSGNTTFYDLVGMGGALYMRRADGPHELWTSDGTEENTKVLDTMPSISRLTAGNGKLFFVGEDASGYAELYSSDGTVGGAALVIDLAPADAGSQPDELKFGAGDLLYFAARSTAGVEPYASTGAVGNATLLKDIKPPSSVFDSTHAFVRVGSNLFFPYDDGVHGFELWKTNGTAAGTSLVEDIYLGPQGSSLNSLIAMSGFLYFSADNGTHGFELWRSDGTPEGTQRLENLHPDGSGGFHEPVVMNDTLYFAAYTPDTGMELFRSDGEPSGASLAVELVAGPDPGSPGNMRVANSKLWFHSNELSGVYVSDGTQAGTDIVEAGLFAFGFTAYGGNVYFQGYNGADAELWKSNGTEAGTLQISHQGNPFSAYFSPTGFTVHDGALYFLGNEDGNSETPKLFRTLGTEVSTTPISPNAVTQMGGLRKVGSRLVFWAKTAANGREPWRSDGTVAGTAILENTGPGDGLPEDLAWNVIGKALFFGAKDATHGTEVWISDGTSAANTFMVQDFNTIGSTDPYPFAALGSKVIFSGVTEDVGRELLGLVSPRATSLSLKVAKTRRKVKARGVLNPAHTGAPITVTLYKKRNGRFRKVAVRKPASSSSGAYATSFKRPTAGRCRFIAKYAGHVDHLPVTKTVKFRC